MTSDPEAEPIRVDGTLLNDLLSSTADLSELKLVLHVLRLASGRESPIVPLEDVLATDVMRSVVGAESPAPGEERLRRCIDRALADGFLLRLTVDSESPRTYLLPSTPSARALIDRLRSGDPATQSDLDLVRDESVALFRPNIFSLYERHVGPLTPLLAEQLRDAERSYPRAWIEDALLVAVENDKRSWRYVQSILSRWEVTGVPTRAGRWRE